MNDRENGAICTFFFFGAIYWVDNGAPIAENFPPKSVCFKEQLEQPEYSKDISHVT